MTLSFPRSIGDGYPEYVDEELGYNYHAWEVISAAESRRHEQIRRMEADQLKGLQQKLSPLSDLERWAFARRFLHQDDMEAYFDFVQRIVEGALDHPALHYPEIFVDVARRRAALDELDRAGEWVDRIEQTWPEFSDAIPLLRAQLLLYAEKTEDAEEAYDKAIKPHKDVDLLIETAEDFHRLGSDETALHWLTRARGLAEETGDTASIVDIELLQRKLSPVKASDADDGADAADREGH